MVSILSEHGLAPAWLALEITESSIMKHEEQTIKTLLALRDMGVKLSIDDFGTGYSSLSYLKRFAVDKLKIDQSFVRDITVDPNDAAIVSAIIAMSKQLGLKTVAEGVETDEQLQFLTRLECDEYQGYLYSKPVAAADVPNLFHAQRR
jgi:EAL domain-containing protein (putative c-di-GMP-specific phosphodiesterase class I)